MPRSDTAVSEAVTIIRILRLIPRHRWITAREIAAGLTDSGITLPYRRLQRILQNICDCTELNIECDRRSKPFGYVQRMPESALPVSTLSPQESLLLGLCEDRLKSQLPSSVTASLEPLFTAARESLQDENREGTASGRSARWLRKTVSVPASLPFVSARIKPGIYDAVSEALFRDSQLKLAYVNQEGYRTEGIVSPLGLVQQESRLYLVCRFEGFDDIRHLALHRLSTAEVLAFPADRPKGFDLRQYVSNQHFNFSRGQRIRLVIEFSSDVMARNLTETPFSRKQTLVQLADGFWHLETDTDDSFLLDSWLITWHDPAGIRLCTKTPLDRD